MIKIEYDHDRPYTGLHPYTLASYSVEDFFQCLAHRWYHVIVVLSSSSFSPLHPRLLFLLFFSRAGRRMRRRKRRILKVRLAFSCVLLLLLLFLLTQEIELETEELDCEQSVTGEC
jgi:4-amino-4-deoxy-L-arabinose transferase-like glycosyltransferase